MRYNPAVVAQAFATMGAMYPGRVGIGIGSGEELNEVCVLGCDWPAGSARLEMLVESCTLMNRLWESTEPITFAGKYYKLDNAEILTKPETKIPVYFSAFGPKASRMAGLYGDHLITSTTDSQLIKNVIFPNFEAGVKEAGKDLKKMERAVLVFCKYDPDHLLDPEARAIASSEEAKLEILDEVPYLLAHGAEDFIKQIKELKKIGFNHIIYGNMSMDGDLSLKVFEDVLPHIV